MFFQIVGLFIFLTDFILPDVNHVKIGSKWGKDVINDQKWIDEEFTKTVQNRGAQVIAARGASSCASAGKLSIFCL